MALKVRKLKLMCINHENIGTYDDPGNVRDEFSSNRQAIKRILDKRTDLGGGRKVPTFMLAEAPTEVFSEDDPFDTDVLRSSGDGEWKLPSEAWMTERAKRIALQKEAADKAANKAADILRSQVADGVVELLSQVKASSSKRRAGKEE